MNELDTARAIRDKKLPSPQKIGTFHLWDLRLSGTGAAVRQALNEIAYRDPEIVLTDETVARVQGLPVVWGHPEKVNKLNSEEFGNRAIGSVMLPYISGDELRAVCRIYDDEAVKQMTGTQLSTSPGVVFGPESGNQSFKGEDGYSLLVEGDPNLWDHVAICPRGVWDKFDPASGVLTSALSKGDIMTDQEKADAARADAAKKMDAIMDSMSKISSRLDAYEAERADKARKDAEEAEKKAAEDAKKDKARRDAARKDRFARKDGETDDDRNKRFEEDEKAEVQDAMADGCTETEAMDRARRARKDAETAEEKKALEEADKARADAARRDAAALTAENAELKARLAAVEAFMGESRRETTAADRDALAASQARADGVMAMFGDRAPVPMTGETPLAYRRRILDKLKAHSPRFKDARFDNADEALLQPAEEIIYNDAQTAARAPAKAGTGIIIPIVSEDSTGRRITKFTGDPLAWMGAFMGQPQSGRFMQKGN